MPVKPSIQPSDIVAHMSAAYTDYKRTGNNRSNINALARASQLAEWESRGFKGTPHPVKLFMKKGK